MGDRFKAKKSIVHLIEWIVSTLVAAAIADLACFACGQHVIKNQFIDATVFSYFIICCYLFVMIFTCEDFEEIVGHFIRGVGAVLYFVTGILLLLLLDDRYGEDSTYYRILIAGVFSLVNGAIFTVEFFIMIFNSDLLE